MIIKVINEKVKSKKKRKLNAKANYAKLKTKNEYVQKNLLKKKNYIII